MTEDVLRYDLLIEDALRDVMRKALRHVVKNGLPGEHHFYITFQLSHPDVEVPESLRAQYKDEMTIVLQYQFYGLKVDEDAFSVMLSFNNVRERLHIPFAAITTFADPSVSFALQFQGSGVLAPEGDAEDAPCDKKASSEDKGAKADDTKRGEVISLDMFRKK